MSKSLCIRNTSKPFIQQIPLSLLHFTPKKYRVNMLHAKKTDILILADLDLHKSFLFYRMALFVVEPFVKNDEATLKVNVSSDINYSALKKSVFSIKT
ncbi:hypothetical protein [Paenibacillus alvei]|uniref:hypothetical protein n=1 Tax=Paenibacillus alvei TaxID=44250 RepID=UPI0013DC9613|nr:hypothetical protein [Paenibacillus alvei]